MREPKKLLVLVVLVATAFTALVAIPTAAGAVECNGVLAAEHDYTIPFGTTLKVPEPGLLADGEGDGRLVEVSWGPEATNPTPSDDESWFGLAEIRYVNNTGQNRRQGGFQYIPSADPDLAFSGIDTFDYWIIDPRLSCLDEDTNTVTITVEPIFTAHSYNMVGGTLTVPAATGLAAGDKGVDPMSVWVDAFSAAGGDIEDNGDGAFEYTPPAGFSGVDTIGYTVDDLAGDVTYDRTATVNVAPSASPPSAPTSVHASPGNKSALVSWDAATGNGNAITSYRITAAPGGTTKTVTGATTAEFSGLANGVQYTFTVRATSAVGNSGESVPSNGVTPRTKPGAPSSVRGSASGNRVTVTWGAPKTNGAAITGSTVVASNGRVVNVTGSGRSATFTGMAPGNYTFKVKSKNVVGYGPYSAASPSTIVAQTVPTYTTRYSEAEYAYLVKTAAHFHLRVQDAGKTGVAVIRYILAISSHPATRPAARPANTGPRVLTTTYSLAENASTLSPVSRYLVLNGSDTLKVGAGLMQYFAALQGVR